VLIALFIQYAMRMLRIIPLSVARLDLPYFSKIISQWHNFLKNVNEYKIFTFIFSTTFFVSEIFLILRRIQRNIINVQKFLCEVPVNPQPANVENMVSS